MCVCVQGAFLNDGFGASGLVLQVRRDTTHTHTRMHTQHTHTHKHACAHRLPTPALRSSPGSPITHTHTHTHTHAHTQVANSIRALLPEVLGDLRFSMAWMFLYDHHTQSHRGIDVHADKGQVCVCVCVCVKVCV